MTFSFHARPPCGEWINDPNGLVFAAGRYRLFVQHSAAAPAYKSIGWARLSSDDLMHWQWDGAVIPPDGTSEAFSGSVLTDRNELTAFLTRADRVRGEQHQRRLTSTDAGLSWTQGSTPLGPVGRNVRDPFVFDHAASGTGLMLVVESCDWVDWETEPPSIIQIWRESAVGWTRVETIGPWSPPGVLWEVPVLLDFGDQQVLIVSLVDRRNGESTCSVRYWVGTFDGSAFEASSPDGVLLDLGPDFYATCVNTVNGWPDDERVMVGWASSWATARAMPWPGGVHGGPISLPRTLKMVGGRLRQQPLRAAHALATYRRWAIGDLLSIDAGGDQAKFHLDIAADGTISAWRRGVDQALAWACRYPEQLSQATEIALFSDYGLLEIFFQAEGLAMTVFVPGATLHTDRE